MVSVESKKDFSKTARHFSEKRKKNLVASKFFETNATLVDEFKAAVTGFLKNALIVGTCGKNQPNNTLTSNLMGMAGSGLKNKIFIYRIIFSLLIFQP